MLGTGIGTKKKGNSVTDGRGPDEVKEKDRGNNIDQLLSEIESYPLRTRTSHLKNSEYQDRKTFKKERKKREFPRPKTPSGLGTSRI